METKTTIIKEEIGRGTRGGPYIYVVDGKELVHISDYATKRMPSKYVVVYEIPMEKIVGKVLYCFDFSRSGGVGRFYVNVKLKTLRMDILKTMNILTC